MKSSRVNGPAHCEESFSYTLLESSGAVLSPDGAKYLKFAAKYVLTG